MADIKVQHLTDEALVERFKVTRQNEYLSELFRRYKGRVFEICRSVLRDAAVAEELTQETFARVFTEADKFHGGRLYAWLCTIAKHICINYLRRGRGSKKEFNRNRCLWKRPLIWDLRVNPRANSVSAG